MSEKRVVCRIGKECTLEARLEGWKNNKGEPWRCHHSKPHKYREAAFGCDHREGFENCRAMDEVCQVAKPEEA